MNKVSGNNFGSAEQELVKQLQGSGDELALNMLKKHGLPTRRLEAYHYTDLKLLLSKVPQLAEKNQASSKKIDAAIDIPGALQIVLENGSAPELPALPNNIAVSKNSGSSLKERDDIIVALNRSLVTKSLHFKFSGTTDQVLHLDWRNSAINDSAAHVLASVSLELEPGATATIIETFSGSNHEHLANFGSAIIIGNGASLTHIVVDLTSKKSTRLHTIEYEIGANTKLHNLLINSGSKLSRTQVFSNFLGEGAVGEYSGLNLVGDGQHCDITLDTIHAVPNTISNQKFKVVAKNSAKAIFQGRISVKPIAQKTDAKMMVQGLMLSEGAQILNKPELEIFADDVQCGHGSTCGELDEDTLFYLMSRGIAREDASSMLIRAFVQELLDPISDEGVNKALSDIVEKWLENTQDSVV